MCVCACAHGCAYWRHCEDIVAGGRRQEANKQNLKTGLRQRHLQRSSLEARTETNLKASVKGFPLLSICTITQRALVIWSKKYPTPHPRHPPSPSSLPPFLYFSPFLEGQPNTAVLRTPPLPHLPRLWWVSWWIMAAVSILGSLMAHYNLWPVPSSYPVSFVEKERFGDIRADGAQLPLIYFSPLGHRFVTKRERKEKVGVKWWHGDMNASLSSQEKTAREGSYNWEGACRSYYNWSSPMRRQGTDSMGPSGQLWADPVSIVTSYTHDNASSSELRGADESSAPQYKRGL